MEKVDTNTNEAQSASELGKLLLSADSANVVASFEKEALDCPIESVTVYNDRAEVKRRVQFTSESAGVNDIVVNGLSRLVEANSVRVSGATKALTILEVSQYTMFELQKQNERVLESALADKRKKMKELDRALREVDVEVNQAEKQKAILDYYSNESKKAKGKLDLEEVGKMLTFIRVETARLEHLNVSLKEKKKDLQLQYATLKNEIEYRQIEDDTNGRQATRISVYAPAAGEYAFSFTYMIMNASWAPSYDVRVETKNESVQLVYYGSVRNTTGEDWKDVKLFLSTASPSTSAAPPPLRTLRVRFPVPKYVYESSPRLYLQSAGLADFDMGVEKKKMKEERRDRSATLSRKPMAVLTAQAESSNTSQTYGILRSCTVDSDNKPHKVTISSIELTASFVYTTIPKLAPTAYLKAHTTNSSNFQLLTGPMNVFSDNFFIASTELKATSPGGEFDVFLGVDPGVKVEFKPVKVKEGKAGMIKKSKTENTSHRIVITNNKGHQIEISVFEQVPLSEDDKVKVKIIKPDVKESTEAVLNEFNNLKWHFKLDPQAKKKIELEYQIDFPVDNHLSLHEGAKEDTLE
eukprot:TRINITY_DN2693_c0_g1_i1.p1 TRINITY_DN2693_c0_g1~~TRINITY_DN2693_c0_g1_i1.p1  ORF type:complete len:593 (+),score=167.72 TRINITY_DN2693_c0_g1_i1:38-1780(+)